MLPKHHILFGFVFSALLFIIFPKLTLVGALIVFLMSFLIDFDHYLFYVFKHRKLSLSKAYNFFLKETESAHKHKNYYAPLTIFHTAEAFILMIVAAFYSNIAFYVLIGSSFHFALDAYATFFIHKLPRARVYTIYGYLKNKN